MSLQNVEIMHNFRTPTKYVFVTEPAIEEGKSITIKVNTASGL